MAKELSNSEYEQMVAAGKVKKPNSPNYLKPAIAAVTVIVLCGISFTAGQSYQKSHSKDTQTTANTRFGSQGMAGGPGGFGNGQRPTVGQVTAVSSDSITIKNDRTGSDQTLKITSSTVVENNGSTASVSDVKVGDTAFVQLDSNDSGAASRIILNPTMQGPGSQGGSTDTTTNL